MARTRPSDGRIAMVIIVIALISAGTAAGLVVGRGQELRNAENDKEKGPVALAFHLVTVDGERLNSTDLKGRPVVLDLMATWCVVCRDEMPMLNDTHNKHGSVVFISIDMDWTETDATLRAFRDQYKVDWTFANDKTGSVFGAFYPAGYPTLIILDRDGRIVFSHEGSIEQPDLEQAMALVA